MAVSGNSSMPKQCPGGKPPRALTGPPRAALLLLAAGAAVLLSGCVTAGHVDRAASSLVAGGRAGPMSQARLALAARVAERFGRAYPRSVYLRKPMRDRASEAGGRLPGATRQVQMHVRASAAHVPPGRRGRRSFAGPIQLEPQTASKLDASVVVRSDGLTAVAVGFTVEMTPAGWRVTSISPPG
jgi:hypothetical protein